MHMNKHPIAVFDSGLGGISVLRKLVRLMPHENFLYFGDSANAPYGDRPTEQIRALTLKHGDRLFNDGAKALVVACNTATAAAIQDLRKKHPTKIIIGIEPALKLAVDRFPSQTIWVLATDATLREEKFASLLARHGTNRDIQRFACPELVSFVERGELTGDHVLQALYRILGDYLNSPPAAIVLGCTHYPFLTNALRQVVGDVPAIIDGSDGTARETLRRLTEADLLRTEGDRTITLTNSSTDSSLLKRCEALLWSDE